VKPRLSAFGALLMALAWGFIDGFFVEPWPVGFWLSSACGLVCMLAAARRDRLGATVPWGAEAVARPLGIAALLTLLECLLPLLACHLHAIEGAGRAAAAMLSVLGLGAGVDGAGTLLVPTAAGARAFSITWEAAAAPSLARIAVAMLVARRGEEAARLIGAIVAYGWCRLLAMALVVAAGARLPLLYEPAVTLITFLPLALVAPRDAGRRAAHGRPILRAAAPLALGAACIGAMWGYRDPGRPGAGRVLIDESHSDWEWTEPPFDHARYGQRSLYNYGLWRAWIGLHYPTVVTSRTPRETDLAGTDVLVIKTPTSPYDLETIGRIERFVRRGGGLYLIGDHTNLFGMSTVLNGVAAPYGIRFNFDDTFPLDHERDDVFTPSPLAPHPILRGIDVYPFETSCTLDVPWNAEHVIVGRRIGAETVDYGHANFFGDIHLDPDERFGLFTQAAVVAHGAGRVAAFSDSTNFSSFSLLWPGRREFTVNTIDWLSRRRSAGMKTAKLVVLVLGLALAAVGAFRLGDPGRLEAAVTLWLVVACLLVAARLGSSAALAGPGPPQPAVPLPAVIFDTDASRPGISPGSPLVSREALHSWLGFNGMFIDAARSGLWPRLGGLGAAREASDPIVSIAPRRALTSAESAALDGFLERGGRFLVIDTVMTPDSAADRIVSRFGLVARRTVEAATKVGETSATPRVEISAPGGEEAMVDGGVKVVWRQVGRGRVVLAADGALLSDRSLGGVYAVPDAGQRRLHEGQRELLEILMAGPEPGEAR